MVNPSVKYHNTCLGAKRTVQGVAIVLKDFLGVLDKYSIQHKSETYIRHYLRGNPSCQSLMKQHFLTKISKANRIVRANGDTRCKTCVCLPNEDIPAEFFDIINDKMSDGKLM